jgi:hypothetical protein
MIQELRQEYSLFVAELLESGLLKMEDLVDAADNDAHLKDILEVREIVITALCSLSLDLKESEEAILSKFLREFARLCGNAGKLRWIKEHKAQAKKIKKQA